jgi:hypothetical protein
MRDKGKFLHELLTGCGNTLSLVIEIGYAGQKKKIKENLRFFFRAQRERGKKGSGSPAFRAGNYQDKGDDGSGNNRQDGKRHGRGTLDQGRVDNDRLAGFYLNLDG